MSNAINRWTVSDSGTVTVLSSLGIHLNVSVYTITMAVEIKASCYYIYDFIHKQYDLPFKSMKFVVFKPRLKSWFNFVGWQITYSFKASLSNHNIKIIEP